MVNDFIGLTRSRASVSGLRCAVMAPGHILRPSSCMSLPGLGGIARSSLVGHTSRLGDRPVEFRARFAHHPGSNLSGLQCNATLPRLWLRIQFLLFALPLTSVRRIFGVFLQLLPSAAKAVAQRFHCMKSTRLWGCRTCRSIGLAQEWRGSLNSQRWAPIMRMSRSCRYT